ncbi:hypothetical protein CWE04_00500 [Thomasclavelia cocleata]|uniref:Uncharacterized protein n=1 Tax=Thomasclavelia cocleata TaxID=69824 RepID=A0A1I0F299_9FIRM|nr:hypothetical protein [Thomasclavelia cocleata]MCR1960672.1 hypothetical protein [Thomasclavelia cocleata]NDO41344.1 hypothetical protein [Thomasclavelia cocleata]PJN81782.1 hypothetical protein CWE04_00500 [Thomasclavelia cocleata]SET52133.1 hypothetical protein SAMN04489758_11614 [Thomasclavelia cocleata]
MKKFLNVFLTIIMVCVIIVLCINLSIRKMSVKTVADAIVIQEVSGKVKEVLNESFPDVSNENIDKVEDIIEGNDALDNITGEFLDQVTYTINNDKEIETTGILEGITDVIDKSIPELEEAIGKKISQEQIDKIKTKLTNKDSLLQNKIKNTVEKIQTSAPKTKQIIKTYDILSNNLTKIICIIGIIIIVVLLGVINKSYFKWTLFSGIGLLVSGILLGLFLPLAVNAMEFTIGMRILGMSIDIPVDSLWMSGLICGGIGIILLVIYMVLNRKYPTYDRHYY